MENIIAYLKYLIIGVVQGFTEPIPVSSSGHVMIVSELLGLGEQGFTFAILTNTASLLAVLLIYRKDLIRIATNFIKYLQTKNEKYITGHINYHWYYSCGGFGRTFK